MKLTATQQKTIAQYKHYWNPDQYLGEDTFNKMMRDLAIAKVGQTDEEILEEMSWLDSLPPEA